MKLKYLNFDINKSYQLISLMQLLKLYYQLYLNFPRRIKVVQKISKLVQYESNLKNKNF